MNYFPLVVNDNCIRLGFRNIHTDDIRCFLSAAEIVSVWRNLEKQGFPLEDITSTLTALEWSQYSRTKEINILPFQIHVVRLVDAIGACEILSGFASRKNDSKERLHDITKDNRKIKRRNGPNGSAKLETYSAYIDELLIALLSSISEFRIAYMLKKLGQTIEFTMESDSKYPDIKLQNYATSIIGPTMAELKARLNRSYTGEEIQKVMNDEKIVRLSRTSLIALACKDAFTKFEEALDDQGADIALIDLSHSQYGDLLAACS